MSTKSIAIVLFILQLCALAFIGAVWYKFMQDLQKYGGEMADTIFSIILIAASIYYFIMTLWSYVLLKKSTRSYLELAGIALFGPLSMLMILLVLYI